MDSLLIHGLSPFGGSSTAHTGLCVGYGMPVVMPEAQHFTTEI